MPTDTPTSTPTSTPSPTSTDTPTSTPTPTDTPVPCSGGNPAGLNIGGPDGIFASIDCGGAIIVDLGAAAIDTTTTDPSIPDFVYYEREGNPGEVAMDWVIVDVSTDSSTWITVFNWGDFLSDTNTNVAGLTENDNEPIPMALLYGPPPPLQTGVTIDIDPIAPPGIYRWIRIRSPLGGSNDFAEVDAIQPTFP
jgi:hypothetical protein